MPRDFGIITKKKGYDLTAIKEPKQICCLIESFQQEKGLPKKRGIESNMRKKLCDRLSSSKIAR